MSAWLLGLMIAALVVLPVALRWLAEEPDNSVTYEQDGTQASPEDEPDGLLAAA